MNEIEIDKLTKASVDIAQAASDYGALKVIFGVFMVVVLLLFVSFLVWLWMLQRRFGTVEDFCKRSMDYFTDLNDHTIGREEAKMIVRETLCKSEALMKYYILKVRMENHVDDKDLINGKIDAIVQNDCNNRKVFLSRFVCVGHSINFAAVDDDNESVVKLLSSWIYKGKDEFTVSLMAQEVSLYYDGLKAKAAMKIDCV